jgi:Ca2+-binding RTX toxin-like protein
VPRRPASGGQGGELDFFAHEVHLTGAATGTGALPAGGVTGFENVVGGAGNDTLTGSAAGGYLIRNDGNDMLEGGAGRDLLIGGLGLDTLVGGAGDDLLIGGTTSHDGNRAALDAIMAEWTSAATYATRVGHLLGTITIPPGLSGTTRLNNTTVFDDHLANSLTGSHRP